MLRKIIKIDSEKCNGCALCAEACHEGAIGMVDGKAVLMRDDYCDGLGDCLPVCPTGAIGFEEREALEYNEAEVKKNLKKLKPENQPSSCSSEFDSQYSTGVDVSIEKNKSESLPCGCPGTKARSLKSERTSENNITLDVESQLSQWPVQIKLVPVRAPYFDGANLLVSADCAAYAYGNFHSKYMKNKVTIIGCPKLDNGDYSEKLSAIIKSNNIKSVTVVRMDVPCCGGIENAVRTALQNSGKMIPWQVVTISTDGRVLEE